MEIEKRHSEKLRVGRPLKTIKRTHTIGIRFTEGEYWIVESKAKDARLLPSAYMRQMAINGHVFSRLSTEEKSQLRALAGMANNVNQITRKMHQEGLLKTAAFIDEILLQLEKVLGRVQP